MCYELLWRCKCWSNWLDHQDWIQRSTLPSPVELGRELQKLGRYADAQMMLKSKALSRGLDDTKESLLPYYEHLSLLRELEGSVSETVLCRIAVTRLNFSLKLSEFREIGQARVQLVKGFRLAMLASTYSNEPLAVSPRFRLLLNQAALAMSTGLSVFERAAQNLALARSAYRTLDFLTYRQNHRAASLAWEEVRRSPVSPLSASAAALCGQLVFEAIRFEVDLAHSAYQLSFALMTFYLLFVFRNGKWQSEFTKIVKDFEINSPNFDIPHMAWKIFEKVGQVFRSLGNHSAAQQYEAKARYWGLHRSGEKLGVADENAIWPWEKKDPSTHFRDYMITCASLILQWIEVELKDKLMSVIEAKSLLRWEDLNGTRLIPQDHYKSKISTPAGADLSILMIENLNMAEDPQETELRDSVAKLSPATFADFMFGSNQPLSNDTWDAWFPLIEKWLRLLNRPSSQVQRHRLLKEIQRGRSQSLLNCIQRMDWRHRRSFTERYVYETREVLRIQESIHEKVSDGEDIEECRQSVANAIVMLSSSWTDDRAPPVTESDLIEASGIMTNSISVLRGRGSLERLYKLEMSLAETMRQRHVRFDAVPPWECLRVYERGHEIERELRLEYDILKASDAFAAKKALTETLQQSFRLRVIVWVAARSLSVYSARSPNKAKLEGFQGREDLEWRALLDSFVVWIQRSKARALADLLGQRTEIPASIATAIDANAKIREIWEHRKDLLLRASGASFVDRIETRPRIQTLLQPAISEMPSLATFLRIQQGESISAIGLEKLGKDFGPQVVLVEWIKVFSESSLAMIVYRDGLLRHVRPITEISYDYVQSWINDELAPKGTLDGQFVTLGHKNAKPQLQRLAPLVAPLQVMSAPGETLVLCPTQELHRLPLHAITFGGRALIERNPVVYIQSLTLLRLCHMSMVADPRKTKAPLTATIFNTLDEDSATAESISKLAKTMKATVISRERVSKDLFRERCAGSNIVHIHGHSNFNEEKALRQEYILRAPGKEDSDRITAEEMFNLCFRKPSLALAMGCNTGRATISEGDDLLGLTAATNFAGAGAVISTLWMIDKHDCVLFSKVFYGELVKGLRAGRSEENMSATVDLARAMQTAILALRKDAQGKFRKPYHWAGFTLHGAWLFPKLDLPP